MPLITHSDLPIRYNRTNGNPVLMMPMATAYQLRMAGQNDHGGCKLRAKVTDSRAIFFCRHGLSSLVGKASEKALARNLIQGQYCSKTIQDLAQDTRDAIRFQLDTDGEETDGLPRLSALGNDKGTVNPSFEVDTQSVSFINGYRFYDRTTYEEGTHANCTPVKPQQATVPAMEAITYNQYGGKVLRFKESYVANFDCRSERVYQFALKLKAFGHGQEHVYLRMEPFMDTSYTLDTLYCEQAMPRSERFLPNPDKHLLGQWVCGLQVGVKACTLVSMGSERIHQVVPESSVEDVDGRKK